MKRILRALAFTGILGAVASAAQAQAYVGFRGHIRPEVVVAAPVCPGPGYVWIAGYYEDGIWIPGRWIFRGVVGEGFYAGRYDRGYVARGYRYDDHRFYGHDRDHDRGFDRR
jgi:hypothetical protein